MFWPLKTVTRKAHISSIFHHSSRSIQALTLHRAWPTIFFRPLPAQFPKQTVAWISGVLRWPGIEPGSTAWKAAMLTTIPPTHVIQLFKVCTHLQRDKVIQEIIQVFTIVLNAQVSQFAYFDHCGFR